MRKLVLWAGLSEKEIHYNVTSQTFSGCEKKSLNCAFGLQ